MNSDRCLTAMIKVKCFPCLPPPPKGRFLKKIGDEKSDYGKVLRGAEKGLETLKKVARTYNKFAQWLALPQVPDILVKEKAGNKDTTE